MRQLLILALLGLAACGTPQERCIQAATKDLRVVEGLIATTRGNLQRGYAIETRSVLTNEDQVCGQTAEGKDIICEVAVSKDKRVPVAIDLAAEQRKLDSLVARRDELLLQRDRSVSQCVATYPEA